MPLVVSAICGDGIKSASEVCDGSLFGSTNTSCTAYGWLYGSVTCASCALDYSACTNTSTPSSSTSSSGGGGGGISKILFATKGTYNIYVHVIPAKAGI